MYSIFPAGVLTFTVSPFFFQIIAVQIGDSLPIFWGLASISDSVLPTKTKSSFLSSSSHTFSIVHLEPIFILFTFFEPLSSSTISTCLSWSSISTILSSTWAC